MAIILTTNEEKCFLEILIPTYNRSRKLGRLLSILEKEIESIPESIKIRITVSDNHSSDETQAMLKEHSFRDNIIVRTNSENIGALRNIWGLYETARADYVWVISDDDIPKPGSLNKIIDILIEYKPTVLTFEFEQPLGNVSKRHGDKNGIEELLVLQVSVPHVLMLGKLTKQVFSANKLQSAMKNMLFSRDTGYGWLLVILEILKLEPQKKIVIFHDFLASCDGEFTELTEGLTPQYWDDYLLLMGHELVKENCHEFVQRYRYGHPIFMVKMIYGAVAGAIKVQIKSF